MHIKSRLEKLENSISQRDENIHVCAGEPLTESLGIIRAAFNGKTMLRNEGESLDAFVSRVDSAIESSLSRKRTETVSVLFYSDLEGENFCFTRLKMFLDQQDMTNWKRRMR